MNQKEKVLNLFGFLMDLIEEPQETKDDSVGQTNETEKVLTNPSLPHHPFLNPYKGGLTDKIKPTLSHGLDLIKKMEENDKVHADEVMKTRIVKKAVKPLISEIEELKAKAREGAMEDKEKEEIEDIMETAGEKMGVTLENGKIKLVEVPTELRDNIPLDEETTDQPIGVSIKKNEPTEIKGMDDLPKEVRDKLEIKEETNENKE